MVPEFDGNLWPRLHKLFADIVCNTVVRGVRCLRDVEDVVSIDLIKGQEFLNEFFVESCINVGDTKEVGIAVKRRWFQR